jgi:hypothetical protein
MEEEHRWAITFVHNVEAHSSNLKAVHWHLDEPSASFQNVSWYDNLVASQDPVVLSIPQSHPSDLLFPLYLFRFLSAIPSLRSCNRLQQTFFR